MPPISAPCSRMNSSQAVSSSAGAWIATSPGGCWGAWAAAAPAAGSSPAGAPAAPVCGGAG
eukprot:1402916-Pyramimonas_sp.AAC.1